MVVFTILASLVKSSGIVILVALVMIFVLKLISSRPENRRHLGTVFLILLFSYFAIVPFAGDYYRNYQKYKTPFVHNHPHKDPPPDFFKRTYIQRPGITSVMDGYFTFRYFDMIREPMITNGDENYPLHRTSLWSQLYGRTFFMHFDQWPPSWVSSDPNIRMAGRVLIILGIFPLLLFMAGFLKSIYRFFMSVKNNRKYYLSSGNDWMYLVFLSGFLLFIMKYTYDYRDFSTMKSIFIFPALPAFIKFYLNGFSLINSGLLIRLLHFITGAIVIFSLYDIGFLIGQL